VTDLIISLIAMTVLPFLYDFVIGPYIDRKHGEDEDEDSTAEVLPPPPETTTYHENTDNSLFSPPTDPENPEPDAEDGEKGQTP